MGSDGFVIESIDFVARSVGFLIVNICVLAVLISYLERGLAL